MRSSLDITGNKFGMLLCVGSRQELTGKTRKTYTKIWQFQCDCGKLVELSRHYIEYNGQKSCGCLGRDRKGRVDNKRRPDNIQGQRFGNLVAVEMLPEVREWNSAIWRCQCDCGNIVNFNRKRLNKGIRLNCGDKKNHKFYLKKYPESPSTLPEEVWKIVEQYLIFTKAEYKADFQSQAIEDEKFNRLLRAAFILYWRRSQGEDLDKLFERRYIHKYLRYARISTRVKAIRERHGIKDIIRDDLSQIGKYMTNVIMSVDSEGNLREGSILLPKKPRRFKFKTC
jgi:hypothetical protein